MEFDFSPLLDSWQFLASGLGLTILLSIAAVVSSFILGLAVALGRLYGPAWLQAVLVFYIDSMRAIPVFVVLVWIYFAVPIISGHTFAPFWAALTGITIHVAACVRLDHISNNQGYSYCGSHCCPGAYATGRDTRRTDLPPDRDFYGSDGD